MNSSVHAADVPAHVTNRFRFVIRAPLNRAAPLFGPEGERCWAGQGWNPEFLYPTPGRDRESGPHWQQAIESCLTGQR